MARNFPNTPTIGEYFTQGLFTFQWTGEEWMAQRPIGSGNFMNKISAKVNAGTYVAMGNFAFSVWTATNRSLVGKTTTGASRYVLGSTDYYVVGNHNGQRASLTINTYATYIASNYHFAAHGNMQTFWFQDQTDYSSYRVYMLIGNAYLNNIITIEQLN
jgi:hypothetical protein